MPFLWSSSGSLGFSEAWPQPAQTAWKESHHVPSNDQLIGNRVVNQSGVLLYLDRNPFSNVQNELHVSVVVVVGTSWHRHIVIRHFNILCKGGKQIQLVSLAAWQPVVCLRVVDNLWWYFNSIKEVKTTKVRDAHLHWPSGPLGWPWQQIGLPFRYETSRRPIGGWSACIWLLRCHCWQ